MGLCQFELYVNTTKYGYDISEGTIENERKIQEMKIYVVINSLH